MPQMCWWISKVDIWCGSPYPAKHLDDLSACRVRKCNDLSHQKYDFFFKPLKLECYLHIFFVDLANLVSKKNTVSWKKNIPWMLKNFPHHAVIKVFSVLCLVPKMSMFLAPFFCPIQPHGHSYWCDHMRLRMPCSKKQTNKKRCSMT